jgi:hypothetical protein
MNGWVDRWVDGCMKGERKVKEEMDGWMGYKGLQQIETRVYFNAKFNKY